jgi:hypothetical protein
MTIRESSKARADTSNDSCNQYQHFEMNDSGITFDDMLREFVQSEYLKNDDDSSSFAPEASFDGFDTCMSPEGIDLNPLGVAPTRELGYISSHSLLPSVVFPNRQPSTREASMVLNQTIRPSRSKTRLIQREYHSGRELSTLRREQVLERNRAAAARCRLKKKTMEAHMRQEVARLRMENEVLTRERDHWIEKCSTLMVHNSLIRRGIEEPNHQGRMANYAVETEASFLNDQDQHVSLV